MPGQSWQLNETGAYFSNNKLSKDLIAKAQPMTRFRQFTTKRADFGKSEGQNLLFDKLLDVEVSGGQLSEGQPIPKTGFKIRQGTCTANPVGNSIPYTEEFSDFSEFDVTDPIQSRLINDAALVLDTMAEAAFKQTKVIYTPLDGSQPGDANQWSVTGTAVTGARRAITPEDFVQVADAMKEGNYGGNKSAPVPFYDSKQNYINIGSVSSMRALRNPQPSGDLNWRQDVQFGAPDRLFAGEAGTWEKVRYVEENHLLGRIKNADGSDSGLPGESYMFGKDAVMEIVVCPLEVRRNVPGDYGRDRGMAYYYCGGFAPYWEYNATSEPDNRIVRIGG
jgi:N4-gp56 family major capsid protein